MQPTTYIVVLDKTRSAIMGSPKKCWEKDFPSNYVFVSAIKITCSQISLSSMRILSSTKFTGVVMVCVDLFFQVSIDRHIFIWTTRIEL